MSNAAQQPVRAVPGVPGGQSEPVWAMNAEIKTHDTLEAPLWADAQFSFLELPDAQQVQTTATWTKVDFVI